MSPPTFLQRVVLKNYKSIAACKVYLRQLTFLVGPNGSGKSNFLDALRFVADSLGTSLDHAMRDRGGIHEVRRRSGGHPTHFGIRLDFRLRSGYEGHYAFRIGARPKGAYEVQQEKCVIQSPEIGGPRHFFHVQNGEVEASTPVTPAFSPDRLYLVNASGLPEFRPVYEALAQMGFYNLNPTVMRELQPPDAGVRLARDGSNLASVLSAIASSRPQTKQRIEEYLSKIVPGLRGVDAKPIGPMETIEFKQEIVGSPSPWRFLAINMSDGTLRALGLLVALFQSANGQAPYVPLVGIEEPEIALHPAATGILFDSLQDASRHTQIIVTSHSPDLLDHEGLETDAILAVIAEKGTTQIAPIDAVGRSVLRERLYTAGELLRQNQLVPDPEVLSRVDYRQLSLFDNQKVA